MTGRRQFLQWATGLGLMAVASRNAAALQEPLTGGGETGSLRDPASAGRSRERATARDNNEFITGVEKRLQCTCGCTLDIYTCRTTDFTCTYSPALHREVLALHDEGRDGEEIIAAFVAKYGEKVLMAPKPEGFNIAGYIVPGIGILVAGGIMAAILLRRARVMREAPAGAPADAAVTAGVGTADEMERLRREMKEFDQ